MARKKGFVRTRTLKQHARDGLIEHMEVLEHNGELLLQVHYREEAKGEPIRMLTAYRSSGPRIFGSIDSAWKFVKALGLEEALIRKKQELTEEK